VSQQAAGWDATAQPFSARDNVDSSE